MLLCAMLQKEWKATRGREFDGSRRPGVEKATSSLGSWTRFTLGFPPVATFGSGTDKSSFLFICLLLIIRASALIGVDSRVRQMHLSVPGQASPYVPGIDQLAAGLRGSTTGLPGECVQCDSARCSETSVSEVNLQEIEVQ